MDGAGGLGIAARIAGLWPSFLTDGEGDAGNGEVAGPEDLVKGDGGYYNPGDLEPGSDTVEGWSDSTVEAVRANQAWGRQMGYAGGDGWGRS